MMVVTDYHHSCVMVAALGWPIKEVPGGLATATVLED